MSDEAIGCRAKGCARIPMMGVVAIAGSRGGKYGIHLYVNHPDWEVEVVGPKPYHATVMILRGSGYYSSVRKINSR